MSRRALQDLLPTDAIAGILEAADIDGTARGETLSFEELDRLAQGCLPFIGSTSDGD